MASKNVVSTDSKPTPTDFEEYTGKSFAKFQAVSGKQLALGKGQPRHLPQLLQVSTNQRDMSGISHWGTTQDRMSSTPQFHQPGTTRAAPPSQVGFIIFVDLRGSRNSKMNKGKIRK